MTGREEHAAGRRGMGSFPSEWGIPAGAPQSEERANWVRSKIAETSGTGALRRLANANGRLATLLRAAELDRRKEGPR